MKDYARFKRLLGDRIGLNSSSYSSQTWERLLIQRMQACGIDDLDLYFQHLVLSSSEFQELVELIIVPETWFFREGAAYDFLTAYVLGDWLKKGKGRPIRILSIPCSTGEEPYSIAISFLTENVPVGLFNIEGIDISKPSIEKAKIGEYIQNSFRSKDLFFRDQYFTQMENVYVLDPAVKDLVNLSQGNLFDLKHSNKQYDVIFCRNLFIYLNTSAQKKAINILSLLLASDGIIVVGPSETELMRTRGFISVYQLNACAFTRSSRIKQLYGIIPQAKSHLKEAVPMKKTSSPKLIISPLIPKQSFKDAKRLADLGDFEEALTICTEHLKTHNTDPEAYFLMGIIKHAQGDENSAVENLQKAVYLDPNHYEALISLALLADQKGDFIQADLLRERAKRSEGAKKSKSKE